MDDIVKAAMARWPNVPDCRGWLGLDARGAWRLRDEQVQAAGGFAVAKGSTVGNERVRAFIDRNYGVDANGGWFFQNGPQRAYVELEAAPWVWRLAPDGDAATVMSHTGLAAQVTSAWTDETGRLFLATELGFGLVHTQDMLSAAAHVETGGWRPQELPFAEMPERFGYCLSPAAAFGAST